MQLLACTLFAGLFTNCLLNKVQQLVWDRVQWLREKITQVLSVMLRKYVTPMLSHQSPALPYCGGFEPTEPLGLYCTLTLCLHTKDHTPLLTNGRKHCEIGRSHNRWILNIKTVFQGQYIYNTGVKTNKKTTHTDKSLYNNAIQCNINIGCSLAIAIIIKPPVFYTFPFYTDLFEKRKKQKHMLHIGFV